MSSNFRKATVEDLKELSFKEDKACDSCDAKGAYRTTEFYLCEECFIDMTTIEEYDVEEDNE